MSCDPLHKLRMSLIPFPFKMANGAPYGHMENTMSPSVGNFVHDLVEMAKAMETLPLIQSELDRQRSITETQATAIASREETILRLKAEIEGLLSTTRKAEADRDDAELRFLELDEKAGKVLRLLGTLSGSIESATELLSLKPEPVAEPVAEPARPTPDVGYNDPSGPYAMPQPAPAHVPGSFSNPLPGTEVHHDYDPSGQSEPDPTASSPIGDTSPSPAVPTTPVETSVDASPSGQSEANPTAPSTESQSPNASATQIGQEVSQSNVTASGAEATSVASQPNEVGYHNEPVGKHSSEWHAWADKMDARYGFGRWPARPLVSAAQ